MCSARPRLGELQNEITPYCAAHWIVIGTQLGIHSGLLQGIQASFPADAFRCCNKMFEIWLDTDCNATWDKIYRAIKSPGVNKANLNFQQDNSTYPCTYVHTFRILCSFCVHVANNIVAIVAYVCT